MLANIECVKNIERIPSDKEFCAGNTGELVQYCKNQYTLFYSILNFLINFQGADICSGDSGGGLVAAPNFGLRRRYIVQVSN